MISVVTEVEYHKLNAALETQNTDLQSLRSLLDILRLDLNRANDRIVSVEKLSHCHDYECREQVRQVLLKVEGLAENDPVDAQCRSTTQTLRTRLECLQDEMCTIHHDLKEVISKPYRDLDCRNDVVSLRVCMKSCEQRVAHTDGALKEQAASQQNLFDCFEQKLKAITEKSLVDVECRSTTQALRTRLECLQDEVCTIHQTQKEVITNLETRIEQRAANADQALKEVCEKSPVDAECRSITQTLRTRLECLQDEVCSIHQTQKEVITNLEARTEQRVAQADQALKEVCEKRPVDAECRSTTQTLRTRLECLQDEMCTMHQTQKEVITNLETRIEQRVAQADQALKEVSDKSPVDAECRSTTQTLRTRLECLQDEVCTIHQKLGSITAQATVVECSGTECRAAAHALEIVEALRSDLCSLQMQLDNFQGQADEQINRALASSSNSMLERRVLQLTETVESLVGTVEGLCHGLGTEGLWVHVNEISSRLMLLASALAELHKHGNFVRRTGGGYNYSAGGRHGEKDFMGILEALMIPVPDAKSHVKILGSPSRSMTPSSQRRPCLERLAPNWGE